MPRESQLLSEGLVREKRQRKAGEGEDIPADEVRLHHFSLNPVSRQYLLFISMAVALKICRRRGFGLRRAVRAGIRATEI